ncbi:trypsin-like peptidase domain-containing protein [Qipengyuania sp. DSG2-2]|uniref:trypsin-like peptidase domain-containing protein n=1 Tax=Qipengyuania sp. DGS2-2 TaxID=3349631 RepID=UPI0036D3056C
MMRALLLLPSLLLALLAALTFAPPAHAEPADIDAAARGVVRVVILEPATPALMDFGLEDGDEGSAAEPPAPRPISHGTGFAVSPTQIVTNAHVVMQARSDDRLRIGIVPGDGAESTYARLVQFSPRADLALIEITGDLRLPPLTLAGQRPSGGEATAVGYPMNVDRAQGLEIGDIIRSQPAVKSRGFLSGERPSREFDTLLHTAPIARGNSGGPLLDGCGRVLGVNSFGADSEGADAEFYFAVSNRELLPFLEAADITPRVNAGPCRSLAELDADERERLEREQAAAQAELAGRSEAQREKLARAQLEAEQSVQAERENRMALALVALLAALVCAFIAWQRWSRDQADDEPEDLEGEEDVYAPPARDGVMIALAVASVALALGAVALFLTRPGLDAIDRRVAAVMAEPEEDGAAGEAEMAGTLTLSCRLQPERSRITGDPAQTVDFEWTPDGCVNGRTQYGSAAGDWSRVFVPNEEAVVSINRYAPDSRTYTVDRYLLGRTAMSAAREARGAYTPPSCESDDAASKLGDLQGAVLSKLPDSPNERLVYACEVIGK